VAHATASRRRPSGDEGRDGLPHLASHVIRRSLFLVATDFADQHDRLRLGVRIEHLQHVDEGRSNDRVAADPDARRLANAGIGHGLHHLV